MPTRTGTTPLSCSALHDLRLPCAVCVKIASPDRNGCPPANMRDAYQCQYRQTKHDSAAKDRAAPYCPCPSQRRVQLPTCTFMASKRETHAKLLRLKKAWLNNRQSSAKKCLPQPAPCSINMRNRQYDAPAKTHVPFSN